MALISPFMVIFTQGIRTEILTTKQEVVLHMEEDGDQPKQKLGKRTLGMLSCLIKSLHCN